MPRFPIQNLSVNECEVRLTGDDYRHIVRVLRMKENDNVTLYDSIAEYKAVIVRIEPAEIILKITETFPVTKESPLDIILYQGILKSSWMDTIVQKCTELGITGIVPVANRRSQLRITGKYERWQRISNEACKQCGRNIPTEIGKLITLEEAIEKTSGEHSITLDPVSRITLKKHLENIRNHPEKINLFIGPEGGFTEQEIDLMEDSGFITVNIGPRTLRAETAAIVTSALVQYKFGDIG